MMQDRHCGTLRVHLFLWSEVNNQRKKGGEIMEVNQEIWPIHKFVGMKAGINLNPQWQRSPVWPGPRQVLLIDSILRGFDIPKVYLRRLDMGGCYDFDVVDGQQRLRAIFAFVEDRLPLAHSQRLDCIDGHEIHGKLFSQLPPSLQTRFRDFPLSIANITKAETAEVTKLFARLQLGVALNPAELRNAFSQSPLTQICETLAAHKFFTTSKITERRYKRQDYVMHLVALAVNGTSRDLKAADLKKVLLTYTNQDGQKVLDIAKEVDSTLDRLREVNSRLDRSITQKWLIVDLGWFIMQCARSGRVVSTELLAKRFAAFELLRRTYSGKPLEALRAPGIDEAMRKHLYSYISAFQIQGGKTESIEIRAKALDAFCRSD